MSIVQDILASALGAIPGIALAMWIGYKRGRDSKRPPKPPPHSHEWGKWTKEHIVNLWSGIPKESNFIGCRNYYVRECNTCGEEQHNTKETS